MRWTHALCIGLVTASLLASPALVKAQQHREVELEQVAQPVERPTLEALAGELGMTSQELATILRRAQAYLNAKPAMPHAMRGNRMLPRAIVQERLRERSEGEFPQHRRLLESRQRVLRRWQDPAESLRETDATPMRQRMIRSLPARSAPLLQRHAIQDTPQPVVRLATLLHAALSQLEWRTEDGTVVKPHLVWESVDTQSE